MADDLRAAFERRKAWFFETQLRGLNLQAFRDVRPDSADARLDVFSEPLEPDGHRVYLDSGQPVWTLADKQRHDAFGDTLIGELGDFLGHREPRRLGEMLAALQAEYEANPFRSALREKGLLARLRRPAPFLVVPDHLEGESKGPTVGRAELAAQHPWLIPELYSFVPNADPATPAGWVSQLEKYLDDFEIELVMVTGGAVPRPTYDAAAPAEYRRAVASLLAASIRSRAGDFVDAEVLELSSIEVDSPFGPAAGTGATDLGAGRTAKITLPLWLSKHSVGGPGAPLTPVADFTASTKVRYWSGSVHSSLRECVANKPNSDMGLCLLVRLLYRFGTLPLSMAGDSPPWRRRTPPSGHLEAFLAQWLDHDEVKKDAALAGRLRAGVSRLRIVLEESAAHPLSVDPSWSPLAGELLKKGLLSYKFWLDEHPHAKDNDQWNALKQNLGYGDEVDKEMEYWSENHYIMFASSEYLLGQLWLEEDFQPGRLVAGDADDTGRRPGHERRDRGRARVLKWLNNRLMFGWMEFNSSGYYREHLWALLNLVDFAQDEEVRKKATMAVDLMLFDVARFMHRGCMGAAGGRSQFKSKSGGFDNSLTDVVELIWGAKGVYADASSEIGAAMATTTYRVPDVLLEIGAHPPSWSFADRSRVSITFEEAAKYAITWSMKSETKDSLWQGYAAKRAAFFPHLAQVNDAIATTHNGYAAAEDDTVFFWGMSAFFNKQVVRNTLAVMHKFGLEKADVFSQLAKIIEIFGPVVSLPSHLLNDPFGSVASLFSGDLTGELSEDTADALSVILEGSTRSRANIMTYRSPGAMLSTIQNFRVGQVNFQSSVQQATLSGTVNVFVNAGFGGLDISDLAVLGATFAAGGVVGGVIGYVLYKYEVEDTNPFDPSNKDGVAWWTGNWSVPRTLQHRGAVIMLSDFHDVQEFLAETGSHAWFPKVGFEKVVERRTSAYDDANFPLLDVGHIGAKGFWLFGRVVHPRPEGSTEPPEEGYVGVFSNDRPDWLTKDDDPYDERLDDEEDEDEDLWKDAPDLFTDKDWYVDGKNIWVVQVGSRSEFGSFEAFMDRVSSARLHIDDTGDLECTYDAPLPGGGSDRVRLTNTDDPEFELNGSLVETDWFPRFENPFVRGGLVEWGQRSYVIEWNGASLRHDFEDFTKPQRDEAPEFAAVDTETIRGLVLHLRTEDEEMDAFATAEATVEVGCMRVATDQTVAAGPVAENTSHDAEWVFLHHPVRRDPDMTVDLSLHGPGDWTSSYTLKALMADLTLRDCEAPLSHVEFDDDQGRSGPRPFVVRLSRWADWDLVPGGIAFAQWHLVRQPRRPGLWFDHHDLIGLDAKGVMWHKRASCGIRTGIWSSVQAAKAMSWPGALSLDAVSTHDGELHCVVVNQGRLWTRSTDWTGEWSGFWLDLEPLQATALFPMPVPLGPNSVVTAAPTGIFKGGVADLAVTGSDGDLYLHRDWTPEDAGLWRHVETDGFDLAPGVGVAMVGDVVVGLSADGRLWRLGSGGLLDPSDNWVWLGSPGFRVVGFAAAGTDREVLIAGAGLDGRVSTALYDGDAPVVWQPTRAQDTWRSAPGGQLSWVEPREGTWWLFATGADGSVRSCDPDDGVWQVVGSGPGPTPPGGRGVVATSRVTGQVEVFAGTAEHGVAWTWWS